MRTIVLQNIVRGRTASSAFSRKIKRDREIQVTDFDINNVVAHAFKGNVSIIGN